jgi:hypothetical protein
MFAGVTSILLNEEEQIISGISSKEGEEVKLATHSYVYVFTKILVVSSLGGLSCISRTCLHASSINWAV